MASNARRNLQRCYGTRKSNLSEYQELGWSEKRQAFVQAFDSDSLDASVLVPT